ncbi:MAG TPA: hypothetical protein VGR22_04835 [Thermomicrobiales bacterium]|nr:hypothetical protein [Thermomicrobiales bacterium]
MTAMSAMGASWEIPIGAPVISADGRRLGVVTEADAYELRVEDGIFVHHAYALNLMDVAIVEGGALRLKLTAEEAVEQRGVS